MRYLSILVMVIVLMSTLWTMDAGKTRTITFKTKYTERKMKYCEFQGIQILPPSKFSTPDGCLKCNCGNKFLKCRPMSKNPRRRQRLGCY